MKSAHFITNKILKKFKPFLKEERQKDIKILFHNDKTLHTCIYQPENLLPFITRFKIINSQGLIYLSKHKVTQLFLISVICKDN